MKKGFRIFLRVFFIITLFLLIAIPIFWNSLKKDIEIVSCLGIEELNFMVKEIKKSNIEDKEEKIKSFVQYFSIPNEITGVGFYYKSIDEENYDIIYEDDLFNHYNIDKCKEVKSKNSIPFDNLNKNLLALQMCSRMKMIYYTVEDRKLSPSFNPNNFSLDKPFVDLGYNVKFVGNSFDIYLGDKSYLIDCNGVFNVSR